MSFLCPQGGTSPLAGVGRGREWGVWGLVCELSQEKGGIQLPLELGRSGLSSWPTRATHNPLANSVSTQILGISNNHGSAVARDLPPVHFRLSANYLNITLRFT